VPGMRSRFLPCCLSWEFFSMKSAPVVISWIMRCTTWLSLPLGEQDHGHAARQATALLQSWRANWRN
jgi:hypothetical protein